MVGRRQASVPDGVQGPHGSLEGGGGLRVEGMAVGLPSLLAPLSQGGLFLVADRCRFDFGRGDLRLQLPRFCFQIAAVVGVPLPSRVLLGERVAPGTDLRRRWRLMPFEPCLVAGPVQPLHCVLGGARSRSQRRSGQALPGKQIRLTKATCGGLHRSLPRHAERGMIAFKNCALLLRTFVRLQCDVVLRRGRDHLGIDPGPFLYETP